MTTIITSVNTLINILIQRDMDQALDYGNKANAFQFRAYQAAQLGMFLQREGMADEDDKNMNFAIECLMQGKLDMMIYGDE